MNRQTRTSRRFTAALFVCSGLCLAASLTGRIGLVDLVSFAASQDMSQRLASFYPAPDAEWVRVKQSFWKRHVVYRLSKTSDARLYHRPSLAADKDGNLVLLTDNVILMEKTIEGFNAVAREEHTSITDETAQTYALFFIKVHLISEDSLHLVSEEQARKILSTSRKRMKASEIEAMIERERTARVQIEHLPREHRVTAFLWESLGGTVNKMVFRISRDGIVKRENEHVSEQPK